MQPQRNMREIQEDEISSFEDEKVGPKIISTKEHFVRLRDNDPFRQRHRQDCDTCYIKGDDHNKGPLVFCQGCTNSYHKKCLGFRGTRDHLVTKVGAELFVLQCRRCLGLAHEKDEMAPHLGRCSGCKKYGELSKPFRGRLTTRQEQLQREENGGSDPITIVEPKLVNNTRLVMFRCSQCARAWHMHHLPERKTAHSLDEEDEDMLDEEQIARKRFEHYHRSWVCKDCVENQHQIDTLVAWRPVDLDAYMPGTLVTELPEDEKEYLIKWHHQSYFRTTWMSGAWVSGIVLGNMRSAFQKKPENQLPKMTTEDAIPEEIFRVDIVFEVRYSSVVRNSTKEIDLARAKEVDMAYVKYKGLGHEDAIWEKPPPPADVERWNDFKTAYEDYVMKLHLSIPPQSTLRRHLAHIRSLDVNATSLIKKKQPTNMTGGELMLYQLEGLNWLLYQWFQSQNAILADEMGLGKTIQLVAFFATLVQDHKCWPFLVVVPNATCPNWRREIKKWAPSLRAVAFYGSARARKLTQDYELFPKDGDEEANAQPRKKDREVKDIKAHIVIASYESISEEKTRKSLMKVPWQGLVVDEGQRLKSDQTKIYDVLSKFRFPFKVLLTGTPLQNNARELFNLLQFLDKGVNAAELEAKYANLTQENVPELHDLLRKFFLRRTKAQVLNFLPPMAQIIVPVTMSTVQKKVYKSILAKNPLLMKSIFVRERDGTTASKERLTLSNILMQLRKCLCHPFVYSREIEERELEGAATFRNLIEASSKLQLLAIMLPKLQERGHRVLMFSQFLDNLDIVEDFLDGLGLQHRRIDGTITAAEKQKRIDEFNAKDSPYFAFLLSTRAGGVGINLATADTVIILDPDFNPHQDIQALSRAHRIGQSNKVLVFQLMTRDSAEEKIMQIGRKKMALDHVLIERMDKEDDAGEDLESILRHGTKALFEEDSAAQDIVYDSASVDKLLDRSQIEDTKVNEDKSAESQFSFARIWANDKSTLEEDFPDQTGSSTPNPGFWDKILQERERVFAEEEARKAQAFGRGKRKRTVSRYGTGK
jgi:chromodomain-helicase-DNA-binding protein 4